jgi:hypothetical protein
LRMQMKHTVPSLSNNSKHPNMALNRSAVIMWICFSAFLAAPG